MEAITNQKQHGNTGNRHRMTAGLRGWASIGSYPKGCSYVRRITGRLRTQLEGGVAAIHGQITPYQTACIQSACRHEGVALLIQRWLRLEWANLSASDKLALLRQFETATDARDRCLEKLGLNAMPKECDQWAMLRTPQANGDAVAITEGQQ
jgi:hypothetical protein